MPSEVLKKPLFLVFVGPVACAAATDADTMYRRATLSVTVVALFIVRIRLKEILRMIPLLLDPILVPPILDRRRQTLVALLLFPAIQSCDSERIGRPACFYETGAAHAVEHFVGLGEAFDGFRKISVRPANSGDHSAHARKNLPKVNAVEQSYDSFRFAKIEDAAFASGTQNADDFAQSGVVVGEIAEAESGSHQIEMLSWQRKIEGIGLDPARHPRFAVRRRRVGGRSGCRSVIRRLPSRFAQRALQHGMRKIGTEQLRRTSGGRPFQLPA